MRIKVVAYFFLNKSNAAPPNFFPKIPTNYPKVKKLVIFMTKLEFFALIQNICFMSQTDLYLLG
jgi:hypothetical protein